VGALPRASHTARRFVFLCILRRFFGGPLTNDPPASEQSSASPQHRLSALEPADLRAIPIFNAVSPYLFFFKSTSSNIVLFSDLTLVCPDETPAYNDTLLKFMRIIPTELTCLCHNLLPPRTLIPNHVTTDAYLASTLITCSTRTMTRHSSLTSRVSFAASPASGGQLYARGEGVWMA
jgi:hypothetical protein